MQIESKTGKILRPAEAIYNIISDFSKIEPLIPKDKVKDFTATEDICSFTAEGAGTIELKIVNREPFSLVKYTGGGNIPLKFFLWIQLKEAAINDTRIKITFRADIPKAMEVIFKSKIEKALNSLINKISGI